MTPREFKAWFEGFTEAMGGCPTKAQWARIKERVSEIDGAPVSERVFIDRYWPSYPHVYYSSPTFVGITTAQGIGSSGTVYCSNASLPQTTLTFDSVSAMNALGRNDAALLTA